MTTIKVDWSAMRIREVSIADIMAAKNWRLIGIDDETTMANMIAWEIEDCVSFQPKDTVVYSGLRVFEDREVRPILVIREVGTCDWWGDMCEFVAGAWTEIRPSRYRASESYVANPLPDDPSFMGEYSHEKQRIGFARWCGELARLQKYQPD